MSKALAILLLLTGRLLSAPAMHWSQLPSIPDREGFAGMFAGVSHGALIVAGGANFPSQRPWEGGTKVWYDDVWVLAQPDAEWKRAGKLPRPLGYGVGVTWRDLAICIGGSNADGHRAEVTALGFDGGKLEVRAMPPLPEPCANLCGALVGDTIYLAGGIGKPDAVEAMHTFWSLDLSQPAAGWRKLAPWPGRERMLAVAGAHGGAFYLFSGAALHRGGDGKPERDWLRDAFRYTPGGEWERLPDLPRAAVAAPFPAPVIGGELLVVSGDDGGKVGFKPETEHPGFPRSVLAFDTAKRAWRAAGEAPFSRATAPVTEWRNGFVIPNGGVRPGYRTSEVWLLQPE